MAIPQPRAERGKVLIPSAWALFAARVLDEDETDGTRMLCAQTLARLVLAASEKRGTGD